MDILVNSAARQPKGWPHDWLEQPPELDIASEMYSCALGDARQILKCAARTARRLEEQFIVDGWPLGRLYGREAELAHRYGVGRGIIRETARILEARGTARVLRGRYGGLQLTAPSAERIGDVLHGYACLTGASATNAEQAGIVLGRAAPMARAEGITSLRPGVPRRLEATGEETIAWSFCSRGSNPVIDFYADWLGQIERFSPLGLPEGADTGSACDARVTPLSDAIQPPVSETRARHEHYSVHRTRAGQIFHRLLASVGPERWTDGYLLGKEMDLCERFEVDRAVLRQAIRILEVSEAATNLPGRGRGLVTRRPSLASLSRLICCHFAAERVTFSDAFTAFRWLGVEIVRLAAQKATPEAIAPLRETLSSLREKARAAEIYPTDLMPAEEQLFALADNPFLEIFVRSAKAYPAWAIHAAIAVPDGAVRVFIEGTLAVVEAVASRDPVAAAAAQDRKVGRLADFHSIAGAYPSPLRP